MSLRALFGTASFEAVAGSELVILEIAESLMARGWECDLAAFDVGEPMRQLARKAGMTVLSNVLDVKPLQYDLGWFQTQVSAAMDFKHTHSLRERTLLAFAHLDMTWDFAGPGPVLEDAVADRFMFPSPEAAAHFDAQGLGGPKAHVFHNAAPARYSRPAGSPRPALRKLIFVSNHLPHELKDAADLLRARGIDVKHLGRGGDIRSLRLLPKHFDDVDAVVSIGKTVQYALRGRVPVFVYDRFGGPGWLTSDNFDQCAYANFSGRCSRVMLHPDVITARIESGFEEASATAASWSDQRLAPYRLEHQVKALLDAVSTATMNETRLTALGAIALPIAKEKALVEATGRYFARDKRHRRKAMREAK